MSTHLDLAPEPRAVRRGRAFVAEQVAGLDEETAAALALLTSELVTNGVLHARTPLQVGVTVSDELVMVAVGDRDQVTPEQRPYSADRSGGRGMLLVHEYADAWGVRTYDDGKTVWFSLRRRPESEGKCA